MSRSRDRTPLAQALIEIRGELSQAAAAVKAGVTREQWVKWENGGGIGRANAGKITAAFGVDFAVLEPYVSERGATEGSLSSDDLRELVAGVQTLVQVVPGLARDVRQIARQQKQLQEQLAAQAGQPPAAAHDKPQQAQ